MLCDISVRIGRAAHLAHPPLLLAYNEAHERLASLPARPLSNCGRDCVSVRRG